MFIHMYLFRKALKHTEVCGSKRPRHSSKNDAFHICHDEQGSQSIISGRYRLSFHEWMQKTQKNKIHLHEPWE